MYAVIRKITHKAGEHVGDKERDEAEAIQNGMAGYYGQLTVDIGGGRFIRIAVWTSVEERATNGDGELGKRADEVYWSHVNNPDIGRGEVVSNTLLKE